MTTKKGKKSVSPNSPKFTFDNFPSPTSHPRMSIGEIGWYLFALLFVIGVGIPNIWFTFVSDQAVAIAGAKAIADGGVLYVDFWDNKMPGLFWFHLVAGWLFEFSEKGVHILELVWMTIFTCAMFALLRRYYFHPWLSALAAIAVVGTYYVSVPPFLLTQLEMLVALPIFLSAWLISRLRPDNKQASLFSFLSGVLAGVTVVFKLIFAPLFVLFWLAVSIYWLYDKQAIPRIITQIWIPATVGVLLILGLVVTKFWLDGALDELIWTAFVYPPQALLESIPARKLRLFESARFFSSYYFAWSAFLIIAIIRWFRTERDLFSLLMIIWLFAGVGLILIQRFSWWPYHFLILFAPAGLLAVRGLDAVIRVMTEDRQDRAQSSWQLALLFIVPLIGVLIIPGNQKFTPYVNIFLERPGSLEKFQDATNNDYLQIRKSIRFMNDKSAIPGDIYVFGDPLYYHLSGRKPALPIIGWPWEYFLYEQWVELPKQLDQARPPYVYIDKSNRILMDLRGGGVFEWIDEHYVKLLKDYQGDWYILKPKFR